MLDPYITPCCDQKLLRFFFERVDSVGHSTFFSEADYPFGQFLGWMVTRNPISEITLALPTVDNNTFNYIRYYLNQKHYCFDENKNLPLISHLNLIVGKDVEVPDDIANNQLVTLAKDTFTYNYLLVHRINSANPTNKTVEADTLTQQKNLIALKNKADDLSRMLANGNTTRLAYEELEGAWIDYMLSSNLATSSKGTYYTLHGVVNQTKQSTRLTSSVTCIKGKYAYDEVMKVLSSVLRTRKVKAPNP